MSTNSISKATKILGFGSITLGLVLLALLTVSIINSIQNSKESGVDFDDPFITSRYISDDLASDVVNSENGLAIEEVPLEKQGVLKVNDSRKVVKFDKELSDTEKLEIEEKYNVEFVDDSSTGAIYVLNVTDESDTKVLASDYQTTLETDIPVKISADKVDWGITRIGADKVWDVSSGSGVRVAIIDTGVQLDHPDLKANLLSGYNFVSNTTNANDDNGHGTHVAGIAAAALNQIGVVGAGNTSKILPVKVLNNQGYGYLSDVAKGIYYAADNGARVINLSLGTSVDSKTLRDAVNYAANKGVLLVGAAGNDGGSPCLYPAAYSSVICVVATDSRNQLASFSNIGGELAAPGVSNYSTYTGSTYRYLSGTSMASPHVAGAGAVVMAACAGCTTSEVRNILRETAVDLGEVGKDVLFGYGLVDLVSAINMIVPPGESEEPTQDPSTEEPVATEPSKPTKQPTKQSQSIKIEEPQKNRGNKYIPQKVEDIKVKFSLSPILEESNLLKTVVYLDNQELYSTTKQSDEYMLSKDLLNHSQHWLSVTAFFKDGKQSTEKLVIDMTYLQESSAKTVGRGRSVLGISFSIFDWLKIF